MKIILNSFVLFIIVFAGCKKECNPVAPENENRIPFEINFLDYSENNYCINEVYTDTVSDLNIFNLFYGNITPIIIPKYYVKDIEVYISVNSISQLNNSIIARAYIDLPPRSIDSLYPDSYREPGFVIPGQSEEGYFRLLSGGTDYIFHPWTGFITFLHPLSESDVIAVAYRIEGETSNEFDDAIYGEFISELVNNSKPRGVLKLVKPMNLQPAFRSAWKLEMKNFYQVAPVSEQITDLDLDIYLKKPDGTETNIIGDKRLLELFGFDKLKEDGTESSDGKFDFRPGINFQPATNELIFPTLQPFGKNIPAILDEYKYQDIYDTTKTIAANPEYNFIIRGTYK
jgi:hypothetical protein